MGWGVYRHPSVDHHLDLLRAGRAPEAEVLDGLLVFAEIVAESTIVDRALVTIAALPPIATLARLLIGRLEISCEMLTQDQLDELIRHGDVTDERGAVHTPLTWRTSGVRPTWELWNAYVREIEPY